jgi:hypothetical protein
LLYTLMRCHDGVRATATKNWSEELFITVEQEDGTTTEYYVDLVLYNGLGSSLLVHTSNKGVYAAYELND